MAEIEWKQIEGQGDHLRAWVGKDCYEVRYEIDPGGAWWQSYVNGEPIGYFESAYLAKKCCEKDARFR